MKSHTSFNDVIGSFVHKTPINKTIVVSFENNIYSIYVKEDDYTYVCSDKYSGIGKLIVEYTKNFGPITWSFE
jgi:hypothetical protein